MRSSARHNGCRNCSQNCTCPQAKLQLRQHCCRYCLQTYARPQAKLQLRHQPLTELQTSTSTASAEPLTAAVTAHRTAYAQAKLKRRQQLLPQLVTELHLPTSQISVFTARTLQLQRQQRPQMPSTLQHSAAILSIRSDSGIGLYPQTLCCPRYKTWLQKGIIAIR